MNAQLCCEAIEVLEPYARRLVEQAEREGDKFEERWFLALQQARLVLRAYDAEEQAQLEMTL